MSGSCDRGVSVVVPCRDAGHYISELLDSLRAQTLQPLEVIVVDDGSTDQSVQVVRNWCVTYPDLPVRHVVQHAVGLPETLRRGWAEAQGRYLARVDADDRVEPQWLEHLVEALEVHPDVSYAYPAMRRFGDDEGPYSAVRPFSAASLVWQGNFVCCGTVMRREDYLATRGVANLPAWEDWDLWLAFLEQGKIGVLVDEELYLWRRHGATRNRLGWRRRRLLRLVVWARHPRLLWRYAGDGPRLLIERARHPIRDQ